jgi:glycogen synthase kinase 3 beta
MNPDNKPNSIKLPNIKPIELKNVNDNIKLFKNKCDDLTIQFLSELLVYDPQKRLKPLEALAHPYFDEIRQQKINVKFDLFDFSQGKLMIF